MTLRIYANESVSLAIVTGLQRRGVDVSCARDSGNLGLTDPQQLDYAIKNQLVLFTRDTDFIRLVHEFSASNRLHWGVIYVHQDKLGIGEAIRRLKELADLFEPDDFQNHIEFL